MIQKRYSTAFTIVELVIVIVVIGILAGFTAIGIGQWRTSVAETEVNSDMTNVKAGMEDYRNRNDGYPVFPEGTEFDGSNATKDIFTQSEYVTITYARGTTTGYCLDIRSAAVPSVYLFIDTAGGNTAPQVGTCDGGAGATPPSADQTVFVFDTTAPGCTGTVQLPVSSPATGGTVDWGDGTTQARSGSLMQHTYSSPGKYHASYTGPITMASYFSSVDSANAKCLTRVSQWSNDAAPTNISFYQASNLVYVAEPPQTVTDMSYMFNGATSFNQNIASWNIANVTNMDRMFWGASAFNQPIGNWNTSNVTLMNWALRDAAAFNQPIGNWNTSKVVNMDRMFWGASAFNQPIGNWNTSNVTSMNYMFYGASAFNQPIGNWNTSKVTSMSGMFQFASSFNQPISTWDTSNVASLAQMFWSASSFNQPLADWNTSKAENMYGMFHAATSFNRSLSTWNTANVTNMGFMFYNANNFNGSIGSWNTSSLANMDRMFYGASAFNQPIGDWNTSNVTNMFGLFYNASSFNQPLINWNTSKVTNMSQTFRNGLSFNQNISGWNVGLVTDWTNFRTSSPLSSANTPSKFL